MSRMFPTPAVILLGGALFLVWIPGARPASAASSPGPPAVAESVSAEVDEPASLLQAHGLTLSDSLPPVAELGDYLGFALAHNPGIQSAWQEWRAAAARVPQATRLPDPRLQYTEAIEPVQTRVGPQERSLSLQQTIPWFGTLSLRGQVASARADAARAGVLTAALDVVARTTKAFHDLVFLERSIAITRRHLMLMTGWEEVARSRYATGAAGYPDVVKAQVELGQLTDRLAALQDRRRPEVAALNAALGRPPAAPVSLPDSIVVQPHALDEGALQARLVSENPDLIRLRHSAASFQQAEKLAGKQRFPDLTLGVNYIQTGPARMPDVDGSGTDPLMVTLGIKIPLWQGAYAAAEREAANSYLSVSAQQSDREHQLQASLEGALYEHRDALRKLDLYGDTLVPKGRQSLGATRAAYEAGRASFLDLVDAERVLLEFELARAEAERDLAVNMAEIERLTGGPLPRSTGRDMTR